MCSAVLIMAGCSTGDKVEGESGLVLNSVLKDGQVGMRLTGNLTKVHTKFSAFFHYCCNSMIFIVYSKTTLQ